MANKNGGYCFSGPDSFYVSAKRFAREQAIKKATDEFAPYRDGDCFGMKLSASIKPYLHKEIGREVWGFSVGKDARDGYELIDVGRNW